MRSVFVRQVASNWHDILSQGDCLRKGRLFSNWGVGNDEVYKNLVGKDRVLSKTVKISLVKKKKKIEDVNWCKKSMKCAVHGKKWRGKKAF